MNSARIGLAASLLLTAANSMGANLLLKDVRVYDGSGSPARPADVRIRGDRIDAIEAHLAPRPDETVIDEHGLALAPGFIDMHTHADRGLLADLDAATQSRQGVTTLLVGQDGESNYPLQNWLAKLEATPAAINVASMAGHATLRAQVMGKDLYRPSTADELGRMKRLLEAELAAGAFGLSTGLEYEEGHFATTDEVIELATVAAAHGGFYISHVRDESNKVFESWDELMRIGRDARIPVEITHIKLGAVSTWHRAPSRLPAYFAAAGRDHIDLKADVYPYTYWHSTIRVLITDRDFFNTAKVNRAIAENGGAGAIRLTRYVPEPTLAGKTLEQIATVWRMTPAAAYMRIVRATEAEVGADEPLEEIIGTSMSEDDLRYFIGQPRIMFCSDGELHGAHPRGAGSFPRVLGRYVRELHVLELEEAIRKMTSLPAQQLGLRDRGRIASGYIADLVLFDPSSIIDRSTIERPEAAPAGIPAVMVSGEWVIEDGKVTGKHPGRVLRHHRSQAKTG